MILILLLGFEWNKCRYRVVFGLDHEEDIRDEEVIDEINVAGKRYSGSKESRFSLGKLVHVSHY